MPRCLQAPTKMKPLAAGGSKDSHSPIRTRRLYCRDRHATTRQNLFCVFDPET